MEDQYDTESLDVAFSSVKMSSFELVNSRDTSINPPPLTSVESSVQSNDFCISSTSKAKPTETSNRKRKISPYSMMGISEIKSAQENIDHSIGSQSGLFDEGDESGSDDMVKIKSSQENVVHSVLPSNHDTKMDHKMGKNHSYTSSGLPVSKYSSATSQADRMFENELGPEESKVKPVEQNVAYPNFTEINFTVNNIGSLDVSTQLELVGIKIPIIGNIVATDSSGNIVATDSSGNIVATDSSGNIVAADSTQPPVPLFYDEQTRTLSIVPNNVLEVKNVNEEFMEAISKFECKSQSCVTDSSLESGSVLEENVENKIKSSQENVVHSNLPSNHDRTSRNPESGCSLENELEVKNVNEILEAIPKFGYRSESYRKWLREFTYQCKKQKYPLSPILCENIVNVLDDLSSEIGKPIPPGITRSTHYVFYRMYKILSEVLSGQMKYALCEMKL